MIDSVIGEELRKRLESMEQTADGQYSCQVRFDPDFAGFQGHFEGNPIMPGVCLIELARVHAESALGCRLKTVEISQCRFRCPVLAGMTAVVRLRVCQREDAQVRLQSEIRVEGNIACQVRISAEVL